MPVLGRNPLAAIGACILCGVVGHADRVGLQLVELLHQRVAVVLSLRQEPQMRAQVGFRQRH